METSGAEVAVLAETTFFPKFFKDMLEGSAGLLTVGQSVTEKIERSFWEGLFMVCILAVDDLDLAPRRRARLTTSTM